MSKPVKVESIADLSKPSIQDAETIVIGKAKILDELGIKEHEYFPGKCNDVEMIDNFLFSVDSIHNDAAGSFSKIFVKCYECLQRGANIILPVSSDDNSSILFAELFMASKKILDLRDGNKTSYPIVVGRNNNNEVIWALDSLLDDNKLFCSLDSQYEYKDINDKLYIEYGVDKNNQGLMDIFIKKEEDPPPIIKFFFNRGTYSDMLLRWDLTAKLHTNLSLINKAMEKVEHNLKTLTYSKGRDNLKEIIEYTSEFYIELWGLIYGSYPLLHINDNNKEATIYIKKFLKYFILSDEATSNVLKFSCDDLARNIMTYRMFDKSMISSNNIIFSFFDSQNTNYTKDSYGYPISLTLNDNSKTGKIILCPLGQVTSLSDSINIGSSSNDIGENVKIIELTFSLKERYTKQQRDTKKFGSSRAIVVSNNLNRSNHTINILTFIKFSVLYFSSKPPLRGISLKLEKGSWLADKTNKKIYKSVKCPPYSLFHETNLYKFIERLLGTKIYNFAKDNKFFEISTEKKQSSIRFKTSNISFTVTKELIKHLEKSELNCDEGNLKDMYEKFNKSRAAYIKELKKHIQSKKINK